MTDPTTPQLINRIGELEERISELKRELIQILREVTTIRIINNNPMSIVIRLEQLEERTKQIKAQIEGYGSEMLSVIEELCRRRV